MRRWRGSLLNCQRRQTESDCAHSELDYFACHRRAASETTILCVCPASLRLPDFPTQKTSAMARTDRDVLLALYRSADGLHWKTNTIWNTDRCRSLGLVRCRSRRPGSRGEAFSGHQQPPRYLKKGATSIFIWSWALSENPRQHTQEKHHINIDPQRPVDDEVGAHGIASTKAVDACCRRPQFCGVQQLPLRCSQLRPRSRYWHANNHQPLSKASSLY